MHFESAEADVNVTGHPPSTSTAATDGATDGDERRPAREGLPAAFRMRHGRHYVEEVMGDAPLRTVREIPIADIEPPDDEAADVEELQQSIRDVGILQPLLVSILEAPAARFARGGGRGEGSRFRIVAGANRYRVALRLGLRTVPCLVCDTGGHTVEALREAAARRAAPAVSSEPPMAGISDESRRPQPAAGLHEVTARLAFVSAVMPALDVAGYDPLRWSILTDLMKVEMERARSTAAAVEWLSSSSPTPVREPLDGAAVLDAVLDAVGPEARLQGVKLELSSTLSGYRLSADRTMLVRAITGLFQGLLALSPAGSTLRVNCSGTAVRPALIVSLTQDDCSITPEAADRFFDSDFQQHPNGSSGALVLAGVAHVARLHGGRVEMNVAPAQAARGCTATFVIPKLLGDA